jgi:hypothetical protein
MKSFLCFQITQATIMKVKCPDFISRHDEKEGLAKAEGTQSVVPLCEDFGKKGEAGKS